jgi:hypothetical protein
LKALDAAAMTVAGFFELVEQAAVCSSKGHHIDCHTQRAVAGKTQLVSSLWLIRCAMHASVD